MPVRATLVVMIVHEAMLRAMLAQALDRAGVALFKSPLDRAPAGSGVLLLDEAEAAGGAGLWVESQWLERRWWNVIVLTLDMPNSASGPATGAGENSPSRALTELIAHWSRIDTCPAPLRYYP